MLSSTQNDEKLSQRLDQKRANCLVKFWLANTYIATGKVRAHDVTTSDWQQQVGGMFSIMVYGNYIGQVAGEVSLVKGFNTSFRRFVNDTTDFYADSVASFKEVTRGNDLNSEIIDFPRRQWPGIGVNVKWLPRL